MEEQATVLTRVHNAKEIPDSTLWMGHTVSLALLVVAIGLIVFAKGPTRKEALRALLSATKKSS